MATRTCLDCPADISYRGLNAKRCEPCAKKRTAGHQRRYAKQRTPTWLRAAGVLCLDCDTTLLGAHGNRKRCPPCAKQATRKQATRKRISRLCKDCRTDISLRRGGAKRCEPCQKDFRNAVEREQRTAKRKTVVRLCRDCETDISLRGSASKRCKPCQRKYRRIVRKEWRADNLARSKETDRAWLAENQEKKREYQRAWWRAKSQPVARLCEECGLLVSRRGGAKRCVVCQKLHLARSRRSSYERNATRRYCLGCDAEITLGVNKSPRCEDCRELHRLEQNQRQNAHRREIYAAKKSAVEESFER